MVASFASQPASQAAVPYGNQTLKAGSHESAAFRAVCFDLDGTLLPMDLEDFLTLYYQRIADFIAAQGLDVTSFMDGLNAGVCATMKHDDGKTNFDTFWNTMFTFIDKDATDWFSLMEFFYRGPYSEIGQAMVPNSAAAEAVDTLLKKGYPLVLTTMPLFPDLAIRWRLRWAGLNPDNFTRLTTYENSTSVKPKPRYFAENLAAMGLRGEDVLMVGNNTLEDLSFSAFGAQGYLVTDCLLNPNHFDVNTVNHGSLAEFAQWVKSLPPCADPAASIETGIVDESSLERVLHRRKAD